MIETAQAKQAGTVILLRPGRSGGMEVLLTRRPNQMAFLGGMYCFPGGTLQKEDFSSRILRRCHGLSPTAARKIIGAHFSPREALGLWVAAIRELFEEIGVLLAITADGTIAAMDRNLNRSLVENHTALLSRRLSFAALLEAGNLRCDTTQLTYFSHWRTPSQFQMRFDTRFFLAAVPAEHSPLVSSPEVADSLWLTPDDALQRFTQGALPMIFPTFASLRTLADFDSLESLFAEFTPARMAELKFQPIKQPLEQ